MATNLKRVPVTPVRGYVIAAKVRSTRKGQRLDVGGGVGREGTHFYDITLAPQGGGVGLTCTCPAFRFKKANMVRMSGRCKHMEAVHAFLSSMDGDVEQAEAPCKDVIVYSARVLREYMR